MRCIIPKATLLGLIEPLAKVTAHRLATLQHALLSTEDNVLTAQGTNLEAEVVRTAPAQTDVAGRCLVHCGRLVNLVKSLGEEAVTLETAGTQLLVRSGTTTFALPTITASEYQPMPVAVETWVRGIPTRLLAHCAVVAYAGKKALEEYGLYLTSIDGVAAVCSTNNQRIALVRDPDMPPLPDVLIPPTLMAAFVEGAASGDETVDVGVGKVLIYRTPTVTVILTPSAAPMVPFGEYLSRLTWPTAVATVNRAALLELAQRAEFFYEAESITRMELTLDGETGLVTGALASELGSMHDSITAEGSGTATAGISPTHLREALTAMKAHEAVVLSAGTAIADPLCIMPFGHPEQVHIVGQRYGAAPKEQE